MNVQAPAQIVKPGDFAIGDYCLAEKVRSCVVVVIEPNHEDIPVKGLLHFNGKEATLQNFIEQVKSRIPGGIAKLAGAGSYLSTSRNNLEAVLSALNQSGIPIASIDVGGHYERSVVAGSNGTFSIQKEYNPFFPTRTGILAGYEGLEERAETVRL